MDDNKRQIGLLVPSSVRSQFEYLVSKSGGNMTAYFNKLIDEKWIEVTSDEFNRNMNDKGCGTIKYELEFSYKDNQLLIGKAKDYLYENNFDMYNDKDNVQTYILYSMLDALQEDSAA